MNDNKTISIKKLLISNWIFFLLLTFLIFGVYLNVLQGKFLSADDYPAYIQYALHPIEALKTLDLSSIYTSTVFIFGKNPAIYHFLAILTHVLNTVLVFILVYLLLGKKVAFLGSLLFALHPLNSEAVNWL